MKKIFVILFLFLFWTTGKSATPTGVLEQGDQTVIKGYAKDPDYNSGLAIHIYIDNILVSAVSANTWRADVQAWGFSWNPPSYGLSQHTIIVYVIGVNASGVPDGQNPSLTGSPKIFTGTCDQELGAEKGWCEIVQDYYTYRQQRTQYLLNPWLRVGISKDYGGTIFEIYDKRYNKNLIATHGGSAMQLSLWGYDPVGPAKWFDTYDGGDKDFFTQAFDSEQQCLDAQKLRGDANPNCKFRGHSEGRHRITNKSQGKPGYGWSAGCPFNPIQAQGRDNGELTWISASNDVDASSLSSDGKTFYIKKFKPINYTSTMEPEPVTWEQWTTIHDEGYIEVRYKVTSTAISAWSKTVQEMPALYLDEAINQNFYYYKGSKPFTSDAVTKTIATDGQINLKNPMRTDFLTDTYQGFNAEGWVSYSDASEDMCITIACFSPLINCYKTGTNYATLIGWFSVDPAVALDWTVYIFPYKYNAVINGKTVRQRINDLTPVSFKNSITYRLSATQNTDGIYLSWTDFFTDETGFIIERKTGNGNYEILDTVSANISVYTDKCYDPSTSYTYRIKMYNANTTLNTNESSITSPAATGDLKAASTIIVCDSTTKKGTATLSWTTNNVLNGQVTVATNGSASEKNSGSGVSGTITPGWIVQKSYYKFRLHALKTCHTARVLGVVLDSVTVYGVAKSSTPFSGKALTIPGIIESENFDAGAPEYAYHEKDTLKYGDVNQRPDTWVDLYSIASDNLGVGWISSGEWLNYTVNVTESATYDLSVIAATPYANSTFHLACDRSDLTGEVAMPTTGDWSIYDTAKTTVTLTSGQHLLQVYCTTGGYNLDKLIFEKQTSVGTRSYNDKEVFIINPNPTDIYGFFVDFGSNLLTSNNKIEILNLQGQILYSHQLTWQTKEFISLENNISKGIYLVKLSNENRVIIKKIVVE